MTLSHDLRDPAASSQVRWLQQVVATTDVHSALDHADVMVAHLHALRDRALIADCGDFFEGTGYYLLGGGRAETALLTGLYDVVAPGNHGYRHHLHDPGLRAMTVCTNVTDHSGVPVFAPLRTFEISGCIVAVTALLGVEAFTSIPPLQRVGHQVLDPAAALRGWHSRYRDQVDSWVVLSHTGFTHDLALARACPFVDVIFSGHCHTTVSRPATIGGVTVVKGGELATGYAIAQPHGDRWQAETRIFPTADWPAAPPQELAPVLEQLAGLREILANPVGPLHERFAFRTPPRHELLACLAESIMMLAGADAVMLNQTCLRQTLLGGTLHLGDLMMLEPFDNILTCVQTTDPAAMAQHLTERTGPIACAPHPLPASGRPVTVVTTTYLADTHLTVYPSSNYPTWTGGCPLPVRDVLRDVLLNADVHQRSRRLP